MIKFGLGGYDTTIFESDLENNNIRTTFIIAGAAIVTEFIPYLAVMDTKFIEIFSMRFLSNDKTDVTESGTLLVDAADESMRES